MRAADYLGDDNWWDDRRVCKGTTDNGNPCELLSCYYSVYCPEHLEQAGPLRRFFNSPEEYKKRILEMDKEEEQKLKQKSHSGPSLLRKIWGALGQKGGEHGGA